MSRRKPGENSGENSGETAREYGQYFARFGPPWLGAVLLPALGQVMHDRITTIPSAIAATLGLLASMSVLAAVSVLHVRTARYPSRKSMIFLVTRLFCTVVLIYAAIIATIAFGWWGSPAWRWTYIVSAATVVLSWNVGRFDAVRAHTTTDGGVKGSAAETLDKLKFARSKVIEATADRSEVEVSLAPGTTHGQVRAELETLAASSDRRVIAGGASYTPSSEWADKASFSLLHKDILRTDQPWLGPEFPGRDRSVTDGFQLGRYVTLDALRIYNCGNYDTGVMPGNTGQGGGTRSGKSVTHRVYLAEWGTRWDAHPALIADTRKALQFAGAVRGVIGHHAGTEAAVGALLRGLIAMASNRNQTLGRHGFDDGWTPKAARKLGMGAIHAGLEEFPGYVNRYGHLLVGLSQFCLSSGIHLWLSGQSWSHDQLPTSLRSQIMNRMQWGADDTQSANYLAEAAQNAGVDPGEWKTQFPGRFVAELNGVPRDWYPRMAKGLFGQREDLIRVTSEYGPQMLPYWDGDLEVFPALAERPVWEDEIESGDAVTSDDTPREVVKAGGVPAVPGEEPEYDEDGDEVQRVPEADPEIADEVAAADGRAEIPELSPELAAVDLRAKITAGHVALTPEQKEEAFAEAYAEVGDKEGVFKFEDLQKAYSGRIGAANAQRGRWFMYEMLGARHEAGEVEPVEGKRGHWQKLVVVTHSR